VPVREQDRDRASRCSVTTASSSSTTSMPGVDDHALLPRGGREHVAVRAERSGGEPGDEHDGPSVPAAGGRSQVTGGLPGGANALPPIRTVGLPRLCAGRATSRDLVRSGGPVAGTRRERQLARERYERQQARRMAARARARRRQQVIGAVVGVLAVIGGVFLLTEAVGDDDPATPAAQDVTVRRRSPRRRRAPVRATRLRPGRSNRSSSRRSRPSPSSARRTPPRSRPTAAISCCSSTPPRRRGR
jgi:hypothetical protein